MQTIEDLVKVLEELKALEASGVRLPYSPKTILKLELGGNVVNLHSGEINIVPGANGRSRPTAKGLEQGG